VLGLAKDVAWIDHKEWEDGGGASGDPLQFNSKRNAHEVSLTVQVSRKSRE